MSILDNARDQQQSDDAELDKIKGRQERAAQNAERFMREEKQNPENISPMQGIPERGVWKRSAGAKSGLSVADEYADVTGGEENWIRSHAKYGNTISGPTHIATSPDNVRIGGLFTLNPLSIMPSTVASPIPSLLISFPLGSIRVIKDSLLKIAAGAIG